MVSTYRSTRRGVLLAAWLLAGWLWLGSLASAQNIPPRLKALVLGASHQPVSTVYLDNVAFQSIGPFSSYPFVMWRADPTVPLNFERTHPGVASWLALSARALGHEEMELVFDRTADWLGEEVWVYQMRHAGVPILDAQVEVHWDQGGLEGVVNAVPGEILSIEERPFLDPAREWVYWSIRTPPTVRLELGWIERETTQNAVITRIVSETGVHLTRVAPFPQQNATTASFVEYPVPVGTFPDQIGIDNAGRVWFSQPNNNFITKFDPVATTFTQYPTTGGSGPDGLWVDQLNRVWTGLYYSGHMGRFDIATSNFTAIPVPYGAANPAIPFFSRSTHVWITDHQQNRISEWDPASGVWLNSIVMPTPNCWVVQGHEDAARQMLYFSEYNVSKIGKKPWVGPVTDIVTPGGGCAFLVCYRSRVFYSNWNTDRMGVYNTVTGSIVEYTYPVAGELGGPIWKTPSGHIVVGTRNRGYIMEFDPSTGTFTPHLIPTPYPGLKDGITVDKNTGVVWFTETGVNKLAKLILP